MTYEPLYVAYLVYFNRDKDYFECHEVLEELWLAKDKDTRYKGMLQVAVGLYHYRNGNIRGAYKMMNAARDRLAGCQSHELGIEMDELRGHIDDYVHRLEKYEEYPVVYEDFTIEITDPVLQNLVDQAAPGITPNIPQRRGPQRSAKHELKHARH
ncbi:DUF309 domain-containing protein [Paenibacillus lemnae]|uniref:DUF309 domain-containing protein n=1 Tax=Paenibacillus lemnae TaxID=1330551 RepID=A0A848M2X6_PAELE|nr:DUF309 domain-containing protein [Paenibacillus lemnae]NMO95358.1 DUF309 domain-containing protein [Paenibacillus lemnae]